MSDDDLVPTGIRGLDDLLFGGLLAGNLALVEGATGTAKTILGTEFVYRGIKEHGVTGTIVSFDTSAAKRYRDAERFGWDLEALQREGRLQVICTRPQVLHQDLLSSNSLLVAELSQRRPHRVFFDGVAMLRALERAEDTPDRGADDPLHALFVALERLGSEQPGLGVLLSHERPGQRRDRLEVAERLADTVIRLRRGRGASEAPTQRSIEIVKSRGQPFEGGRHSIHVTDRGLRVYRCIHAPPRSVASPPARSPHGPLGVAPLDELLGGPLPRGTTTLVEGPSGTGKTLLGIQVLEAGARTQEERGLLVTLDETPAQVLRNAASIGLALEQAVEAGALQLLHASPRSLDIHAHFHHIREAVERTGVERLVVDGLGSYAGALHSPRVLCDFLHALVALGRECALTTFLTRAAPAQGAPWQSPDGVLYAVADHIVVLDRLPHDTLRRSIRIAKARGVDHALELREYRIGAGGLRLLASGEAQSPDP